MRRGGAGPSLAGLLGGLLLALALAAPALAQQLSDEEAHAVDARVAAILGRTGVPSASIAVVRDGQIAYLQAYGEARPGLKATAITRYSIGSITKEFTAAAVLLLVEDGRVGLDDPVGAYVPGVTGGDIVTVRQVLTMTAGYRDYWPQDYVPPMMRAPITADVLLTRWAHAPLDFKPGEDWQYSNTSYAIAGALVEAVTGKPLWAFLQARIFTPLRMDTVADIDGVALPAPDALGFTRYALGPVRPAPKEGAGWLHAIGDLAMNPRDLAMWDISLIRRSLLQPKSYKEQQKTAVLASGRNSEYGLGLFVTRDGGRKRLEHGGEVSGFLAENRIFPDDGVAIIVFTNADFGAADRAIADAIQSIVLPADDGVATARALFDGLRAGKLDRSLLSANAGAYFTAEAVADFAASLGPLGEPQSLTLVAERRRGGMVARRFEVAYPSGRRLRIIEYVLPNGQVEQFLVQAAE